MTTTLTRAPDLQEGQVLIWSQSQSIITKPVQLTEDGTRVLVTHQYSMDNEPSEMELYLNSHCRVLDMCSWGVGGDWANGCENLTMIYSDMCPYHEQVSQYLEKIALEVE